MITKFPLEIRECLMYSQVILLIQQVPLINYSAALTVYYACIHSCSVCNNISHILILNLNLRYRNPNPKSRPYPYHYW